MTFGKDAGPGQARLAKDWYGEGVTWPRWVLLLTGIVFMGMGVQAYFFPHGGAEPSRASLMAAGGGGLLLVLCAIMSMKYPRPFYIAAVVLCVAFAGRFLATGDFKLYPNLVTIILALGCAACLLAGHFMAQKAKKAESA